MVIGSGIFSDLNEVLEPVNIDYLLRKYIGSILLFLVANKVYAYILKNKRRLHVNVEVTDTI